MATKLHRTLSGSDPYPNKIDGTTGTELTTPSETIYDARRVKGKVIAYNGANSISNTSAETAFSLTHLIPANALAAGKALSIRARGLYNTSSSPGRCVRTGTTGAVGECGGRRETNLAGDQATASSTMMAAQRCGGWKCILRVTRRGCEYGAGHPGLLSRVLAQRPSPAFAATAQVSPARGPDAGAPG